MRIAVVVLSLLVVRVVSTSADTLKTGAKVLGWTADGRAVVSARGAPLDACTPQIFDAAGRIPEKPACTPCGADAATCGVVPGKPIVSMRSPDRRLALVRSERCSIAGHEANEEHCAQVVSFPRLGSIEHNDDVTPALGGKRSRVSAVFRPDSGAVAIVFSGGSWGDEVVVVDLADLAARDRVPVTATALLARQAAALAGSAADPIYTTDAALFTDEAAHGALVPAELAKVVGGGVTFGKADIDSSHDGHAAWASFVATTVDQRAYRVTELLVRQSDGAWRIAGGFWTLGMPDAEVAARAIAGTLPPPTEVARRRQDLPDELSVTGAMMRDGDPELLAWFTKRPGGMLVGTAPAERFVGGARLGRAWAPWFKAGIRGERVRGASSPRGSTGWIVTNVRVTQTKDGKRYALPVRVWLVTDRSFNDAAGGSFEIVLAHAAVTR